MIRHYFSDVTGEYITSKKLLQKVGHTTSQPLPEVELAENEYFAMLDNDGNVSYWPDDNDCGWQVKARFEKVTAYNKQTQEPKEFDDKSLVTDDYTMKSPPSPYHTLSDQLDDWDLTPAGAVQQRADVLKASKAAIDNKAASITSHWTRFSEEHAIREAQALAFKEADYQGECGAYVTMFSQRANLTPAQAIDLILQQAEGLRTLKEHLANERMRKYELDACDTIEDIQALTTEIITNLTKIGDGIQ